MSKLSGHIKFHLISELLAKYVVQVSSPNLKIFSSNQSVIQFTAKLDFIQSLYFFYRIEFFYRVEYVDMRPCGFAEAYSEHCQASKIDI